MREFWIGTEMYNTARTQYGNGGEKGFIKLLGVISTELDILFTVICGE